MNQTKASKGEDDMMSKLPDHILELILSRLPINEVVRTSIISKRWRCLWKYIPSFPSLHFDCFHLLRPYYKYHNKFKNFVDWALANQTHLDLHTFSLSGLDYYDDSMVDKWIHTAVMRKVKSLDLMIMHTTQLLRLPHSMINCDSLESLRLVMYQCHLTLPNSAKFPSLRVLELNSIQWIEVYQNLLEWFSEGCPLLEDFSLINCITFNWNIPLRIISPNLKTLRVHNLTFYGKCHLVVSCPKLVVLEYIKCPETHLVFENLDSIKKAAILPNECNLHHYVTLEDISKLFAVISHVESLSLNHYFIRAINVARDQERNFPTSFPNLKTLELSTTITAFTLKVIVLILKCSPNLESLNLIIQEEYLWQKLWELDEVETTRILTHHLKKVKFLGFNGEKAKLDIARLLLEHGNALEEMVFSWRDKVKFHEKSIETMDEVSKFHKASSIVKLIAIK